MGVTLADQGIQIDGERLQFGRVVIAEFGAPAGFDVGHFRRDPPQRFQAPAQDQALYRQQHCPGRGQPAPQTAPEAPELIAEIALGLGDPEGVQPILIGGDFPTDGKGQNEQRRIISGFQRGELGITGSADGGEKRQRQPDQRR